MIEINKELLDSLFVQAESSDRKRINHDLRTSLNDGGQRMPMSNENVILLVGKMDEVFYDDNGIETERIHLDPSKGNYGCVVPQCAWHTVEVLEPCVIYEAKDGKYGEDESETLDEYKSKRDFESFEHTGFSNSLGDLKKNIEYLIGMERQSGSMDVISPLYVSRMLNVPLEDVEQVMKEL